MYLLVGLGNPGKEYAETRHNAGRLALLSFQKKSGFPEFVYNKKFNALITEGKLRRKVGVPTSPSKNKMEASGEKVVVALPETMMNASGKAINALATFYKVKPDHVIIINDDADIVFGKAKISFAKSSGGHRGVESARKALKTEKFWRIRIGIQPSAKKHIPAMDLVLRKFKPSEMTEFKKLNKKITEAIELFLADGPDAAMNFLN